MCGPNTGPNATWVRMCVPPPEAAVATPTSTRNPVKTNAGKGPDGCSEQATSEGSEKCRQVEIHGVNRSSVSGGAFWA